MIRRLTFLALSIVVGASSMIFLNQSVGASAGLSGTMTFSGGWTSSRSPSLSGTLRPWCNDMALGILDDTGTLIALFSDYDPGLSVGGGNWSANLSAEGIGLINGYYHIFTESKCGYSSYADPLYSDIFMDSLYIVPPGCDSTCIPVHRFYNFKQGSHFYTSSEDEKRQVMKMTDIFRYEGITSFAKDFQDSDTLPVHRFYNFKQGVHFYTSNQAEATYINNNLYSTFRYEGVSYYSFVSPGGRVPVYRFYNFLNGVHFYTSNQTEATNINNTASWTFRYEGISYYNIANN